MSVISILIAAILPFIVWPLEAVLPYPAMIEEVFKAGTVFVTGKDLAHFSPRRTALGIGFFFAMSESVLYLYNIASVGGPNTFLIRLALTIPLHAITTYISARTIFQGRAKAISGVLGAILIHYAYNLLMGAYHVI